ncbi:MAG: EAL domain-containing protein [Candidatus Weimeria sp.]
MVIFLTSSFIDYATEETYVPKPMDNSHGFADNLRKFWKQDSRVLFFASDPDDFSGNDFQKREFVDCLRLAGFSLDEVKTFDSRCHEDLKSLMNWADVVFLAGGKGPTENHFINEAGLKEALEDFEGIFIGLSAGSVNAADDVFMVPELPGEASDPDFPYHMKGLGLTDINIIPHIQYFSRKILDGKRMIDDIIRPKSMGLRLYLITDGSYFMIRGMHASFHGKGWALENGRLYDLKNGPVYVGLNGLKSGRTFDISKESGFDAVFNINPKDQSVHFIYYSDYFLKNGISDLSINRYDQMLCAISENMVVDDEKQVFIDETRISNVLYEMKGTNVFARTFHVNSSDGSKALSLKIYPYPGNTDLLIATIMDIERILDHDWMTDEYSREGFINAARKLLDRMDVSEKYSICYANIDNFKALNTLFGRKNGDMIIFNEQYALKEELHPVILGRFEADHFGFITKDENLTEEALERVTTRIFSDASREYSFNIRIGVYHITDRTANISMMLDHAHLAEKNIRTDRRQFVSTYDNQMNDDYMNRQVLTQDLDDALKNRELMPFFQPVVDVATKKIVSAEALIRWNHHSFGMLSPGKFIPVFEENGEISNITKFMVDSVLSFNEDRKKNGLKPIPCAVNLSRIDFYNPQLVNYLMKKLKRIDDVTKMIKIEVTESAYAVLEEDGMNFLNELQDMGINILLDDYGSGMSSLSTLESFAFDTIKLDMGFIRKIGTSRAAEAIIRSTIDMAHSLNAVIVAEGVETKEQNDFLRDADCDMIQGYLYYKPMPRDEFASLLKN